MWGWSVWQTNFLGNPLDAWVVSGVIFLITFTLLPIARRFVLALQRRRAAKPLHAQRRYAADLVLLLVERTSGLFLLGAAVWLGSRDLTFPPRLESWLSIALVLLFWMQVALWAMAAVRFAIDARRVRSSGPDTLLKSSMEVILFAAGIIVWGVALLLALDNLGVQIKPLLAGLGIGGIAIALAVQTVLSDLLASLAIALDKPFGIGDALAVDDCTGTVEHIGVKSTRLRSINGEQIIISNSDLLKARLRNYGRLQERRSLFLLDVHYDTPVATLAALPRVVREIIEATPDTRFDRCHLLRCTDSALQLETVYYVTRADYRTFADAQQSINLRILERFRAMEVVFTAVAPKPVRLSGLAELPHDAGGQQRLL
jgi:small-conductance mechanosensitive channel